jgi:hypothetical protein
MDRSQVTVSYNGSNCSLESGYLNASTTTNAMNMNATSVQFNTSNTSFKIEPSLLTFATNVSSTQLSVEGLILDGQTTTRSDVIHYKTTGHKDRLDYIHTLPNNAIKSGAITKLN